MNHMYSPITIPITSPCVDEHSDFELGWEPVVSVGTGSTVLLGSIVLTGAGRESTCNVTSRNKPSMRLRCNEFL